jgi:hypothetical protein
MDRMDLEEEEEEDSGRMDSASASTSLSPSPERQPPPHRSHHLHHRHHLPRHRGRQAVGILSDEPVNGPQTLQVAGLDGGDAHIIINEAGDGGGAGGGETFSHAAANFTGPGTAGTSGNWTARAALSMSRDRTVQPHHRHHQLEARHRSILRVSTANYMS